MHIAHILNPLAEAVVHEVDGQVVHIDVSAYSTLRGFTRTRLVRGETRGLDAALRLLARGSEGEPVAAGLLAAEALSLWQAGLIIVPQERADAFVPDHCGITGNLPDEFARQRFMLIPQCLTPAATAAVVTHYRALIARRAMQRGDGQSDRYVMHNDAAGRILLRALRRMIERTVGRPIKCSHAYTALYVGGTELPKHTDREQCEYTLSLQLDYRPMPEEGPSPWPLQLFVSPAAPPLDVLLPIGGGLLFRGREVPHSRPLLTDDNSCWMLLLHYVDADFPGPLG